VATATATAEEYGEPDISEDDLEESSTSESSSPRPTTYSSVVQSTATAGVDDNNNGSNLGSKAGDNTENDTSMIGIAMALVVGLIVVATAVFVNGRRAQSRVRDLHAIIGSRGMTGNRNPLYNTRFSFQSNPMFENPAMHAELTQIETHSHPKMAISSDLGENNTRNDWNMFATLNNQGKTWHSSGSISGGANNSLNNNKMPGSSGSMNGDKFNTGSGQL
jgi:hypothetical protein